MEPDFQNHYAALGLDRDCSAADIRMAYLALAKMHHPDVNQAAPDAMARTQAINHAYSILGHTERRRVYDEELDQAEKVQAKRYSRPAAINIKKDIQISIQDLIRGTTLDVCVNDPANRSGTETYELVVPPETMPGSRFRLKRTAPFASGVVLVRVKARSDARYKVRGSDIRCDLKINFRRATAGGSESIRGPMGNILFVKIPPNVSRGENIRIPGEGLPRSRGGRGDLLVRISYRPEVRITRASPHGKPTPGKSRAMLRS